MAVIIFTDEQADLHLCCLHIKRGFIMKTFTLNNNVPLLCHLLVYLEPDQSALYPYELKLICCKSQKLQQSTSAATFSACI